MNYKYLNDTVWCKLGPSKIHGVGVFAIRDIPKGTRITDFDYSRLGYGIIPICMKEEEFKKILLPIRQLILDRMIFHKKQTLLKFISPNHDQCLQSFMNHADNPNSKNMFALRDIKEGEEVTESFPEMVGKMHPLSRKHHPYL